MAERRKYEVELKGKLHWIPYTQLRGRQTFADYESCTNFFYAYQRDPKPVPPPTAFFDKERGLYILDDGHHRIVTMVHMAATLHRAYASGIDCGPFVRLDAIGRPHAFVRFGGVPQCISYGAYIDVFTPAPWRKREDFIIELNRIKVDKQTTDKFESLARLDFRRSDFRF